MTVNYDKASVDAIFYLHLGGVDFPFPFLIHCSYIEYIRVDSVI